MKRITISGLAKNVVKRWAEQYPPHYHDEQKQAVTRKLRILEADGVLNPMSIEAVIGNASWTRIECDECRQEVEAATCFAGHYEDGPNAMICDRCLKDALSSRRIPKDT